MLVVESGERSEKERSESEEWERERQRERKSVERESKRDCSILHRPEAYRPLLPSVSVSSWGQQRQLAILIGA